MLKVFQQQSDSPGNNRQLVIIVGVVDVEVDDSR
jgi:hypothetical protein